MTPRPQDPQNNSPLRLPRLAPIAAPISVGRGVSQGQFQVANEFAGLSESLARSLAKIRKLGADDERRGGALAAYRKGEIPANATSEWREAFHQVVGRQAGEKHVNDLTQYVTDSLASDQILDPETGEPVDRKDMEATIRSMNQEYMDKSAAFQNEHFQAGFNPIVEQQTQVLIDKYRNEMNTREQKVMTSSLTTSVSTGLTELLDIRGGHLLSGDIQGLKDLEKSIRIGLGVELTAQPDDVIFEALYTSVYAKLGDDDSDLEDVLLFTVNLLNEDGLAGTTSFQKSATHAKNAVTLLEAIEAEGRQRETRKNNERIERRDQTRIDVISEHGNKTPSQLVTETARVQADTDMSKEQKSDSLEVLANLMASANARKSVGTQKREESTIALTDRLYLGHFNSQSEFMTAIVAAGKTINQGDAATAGQIHFRTLRTEEENTLTQWRKNPRLAAFNTSVITNASQLPVELRAMFVDQGVILHSKLTTALRERIKDGERDFPEALVAAAIVDRDALNDKIVAFSANHKDQIRSSIDHQKRGDFSGASDILDGMAINRLIDPKTYDVRLQQNMRAQTQEDEAHSLTGSGTVGALATQLDSISGSLGRQLDAWFRKNDLSGPTRPKDGTPVWRYLLKAQFEADARKFRVDNRDKYTDFPSYQMALEEHLGESILTFIGDFGEDEQKLGAKLIGQLSQTPNISDLIKEMLRAGTGGATYRSSPSSSALPNSVSQSGTPVSGSGKFPYPKKSFPIKDPDGEVRMTLSNAAPLGAENLSTWEEHRTNEYTTINQTQESERGTTLLDFRSAGQGLSVEEVTRGVGRVSITLAQKEAWERNKNRVLNHKGARGYNPGEDVFLRATEQEQSWGSFRGSPFTNSLRAAAPTLTFGAFMTSENESLMKSRAKAHYDRMISMEAIEVPFDVKELGGRLADTLVFANQGELDTFKKDQDHPYRTIFDLRDTVADRFAMNQQLLLDTRNDAAPGWEPEPWTPQVELDQQAHQAFIVKRAAFFESAKEEINSLSSQWNNSKTIHAESFKTVINELAAQWEAGRQDSIVKSARRADTEQQGKLDDQLVSELETLDMKDRDTARSEEFMRWMVDTLVTDWDSKRQARREVRATAERQIEAAAGLKKALSTITTQWKAEKDRKKSAAGVEMRKALDGLIKQWKAQKVVNDRRKTKKKRLSSMSPTLREWDEGVLISLERMKRHESKRTPSPSSKELSDAISSSPRSDKPEVLRGFLKLSKTRRHVWAKGVKDDPGVIWDRIRGDEKLMARYLKYLERLNK